jgi:kynurenine 3-monooxygenase
MPDRIAEFAAHPTGFLGTVYANSWYHAGMTALVGDAAHAIVPFHGQGMNCCFEDCLELDACVERHSTWEAVFADFAQARKADTDAIAAISLENYEEMRARVVDSDFQLQQLLSRELEARHPTRFIPRYSMVMFHHEIPYRIARQRGMLQAQLLRELTAGANTLADVDFGRARREIEARLPPIERRG